MFRRKEPAATSVEDRALARLERVYTETDMDVDSYLSEKELILRGDRRSGFLAVERQASAPARRAHPLGDMDLLGSKGPSDWFFERGFKIFFAVVAVIIVLAVIGGVIEAINDFDDVPTPTEQVQPSQGFDDDDFEEFDD